MAAMLLHMPIRLAILPLMLALASAQPQASAQNDAHPINAAGPARAPNAEATYAALRGALPSGEGVSVKEFTLERQGATFYFEQGAFYFYGPVNGQITGAVFIGKGRFNLTPVDASERHSLALLAKNGVMAQVFSTVTLRFTDGSEDEIRKASAGSAGNAPGPATQAGQDLASGFRRHLHENLDLLLLDDVLNQRKGGFFLASFRMGGIFSSKNVLFIVDPKGAPHAAPDEVELTTWNEESQDTWAAYRMSGERIRPGVGVHVLDQTLDVTFEKSGTMHCIAETRMTVKHDGLRVVRLNIYPTLRVAGVFDEAGKPLDFVQEGKDLDPDFAIVLPEPAKAGQAMRLLLKYGGPDAVRKDGPDTFYLMSGARESWYPSGQESLGGFAGYRMTFHLPKGLQIVATGKEIEKRDEDHGGTRDVWATDAPIAVAGFNLGNFKSAREKTPEGFDVSAYANVSVPDFIGSTSYTLSTTSALPILVAQGSAAIQVYTNFFGKLPYDHLALTQQSACNYGQSWPMLVYLPICAFWDSTIQQRLGLLAFDRTYWSEVTPHEVSHQWWGQMVGFASYRDQWMSEGFANFSVGLYLLQTNPKMDEYRDFWNEQHRNLLQKNTMGVRPIDAGPLTMGYRAANDKVGNIYQLLIYSKGAYVMHMLEMMYWTPQQQHEPFKRSMQAFVSEYRGKAASTEDLKRSFERTMPKWVDLDGNGKLDWFFNEYVYGTELPHYTLASDFTTADGETSVHIKLQQSNISKDFRIFVPIYLQMQDGRTVRIASIPMRGEQTFDRTVKLGKLPAPAKKLLLNYNADVLTD